MWASEWESDPGVGLFLRVEESIYSYCHRGLGCVYVYGRALAPEALFEVVWYVTDGDVIVLLLRIHAEDQFIVNLCLCSISYVVI